MTARSVLLALGALLAALWGVLGPGGAEPGGLEAVPTAVVEGGAFEVRVRAVGELQPVDERTIVSGIRSNRGKIVHLVEEGTQVQAGDLLVGFDPTPFEEERDEAKAEVALAAGLVRELDQALQWEETQAAKRVEAARFELEVAKLELHRYRRGEAPLELARYESELAERESEWSESDGFLEELEGLLEAGHVNEAEVAQIQKRVEKGRRDVDIARSQLDAFRDYILPARVSGLELKVDRAEMELEATEAGARFKVGEAQAALERSRERLLAAREALRRAQDELERTRVVAPQPGMVVLREEFRDGQRRKPRVGDTVWQNQPLLYLPDLSRMAVRTEVREIDVHKVQEGHPAVVRVDAFPGEAFHGTVAAIGVLAERDPGERGDKTFDVTVTLEDGNARLRPGMTARVDVLSSVVEEALTVPIQAVWERDGETWCWVEDDAGFERRSVVLGPRNEHRASVERGLRAGERVALADPGDAAR